MRKVVVAASLLICLSGGASAQRDSVRAHAAYEEGRAALEAQRIGDAIKAFQNAIALDSLSSEYHRWLGNAHLRDLMAASFIRKGIIARRILPEYDRAVALSPRSLDAADARLGFYLNAPAMVGGGMDNAKTEAARIRSLSVYRGGLAQAQIDEKEGNVAKAEADYRELMRAYPDSSRPIVSLALLLQAKGHYAEAFTVIDERLAKFPNDTMVYYQLGRVASISGKELSRGEAALRKYLSLLGATDRPSQAAAHYRLGMIHEKQGDPVAARGDYDQAMELNPRYDEAIAARKKLGR
jgi:tetratricopeptide (TPR) repeat protein